MGRPSDSDAASLAQRNQKHNVIPRDLAIKDAQAPRNLMPDIVERAITRGVPNSSAADLLPSYSRDPSGPIRVDRVYQASACEQPHMHSTMLSATAPAPKDPSQLLTQPSSSPASDSKLDETAPPPYESVTGGQYVNDENDLTSGFSSLNLDSLEGLTRDQTTAHLKLLECFYHLRRRIASSSGIFGITDSGPNAPGPASGEDRDVARAFIGEKRWSVYIAKAVDRFEKWRDAVAPATKFITAEECHRKGDLGMTFDRRKESGRLAMTIEQLPPIDVLMVWHTYMLNPRVYLEDCIREGRMALWNSAFPWKAVAAAIDNRSFVFDPPYAAQHLWTRLVDTPWLCEFTASLKVLRCPGCTGHVQVPWTRLYDAYFVGVPKPLRAAKQWAASGRGFADQGFQVTCSACHLMINHDRLIAARLVHDITSLVSHGRVMRGMVLGRDGMPFAISTQDRTYTDSTCASIKWQIDVFSTIGKHLVASDTSRGFVSVREVVDTCQTLLTQSAIQKEIVQKGSRSNPGTADRVNLRRVFSRYWDNPGPFGLDLASAIVRQGSFVTKMHDLDWLHSPALHHTMTRSIMKYFRFMSLMSANKNKFLVPTLEIDLAWHTHQLSPYSYLVQCLTSTGKFIDHDDKVAELQLNTAFAETTKLYQKAYSEPYSECTCWFCEAVRETIAGSASNLFRSATLDATYLHKLDARTTPLIPQSHEHISTHSACVPQRRLGANSSFIAANKYDSLSSAAREKLMITDLSRAAKRSAKTNRPNPHKAYFPASSDKTQTTTTTTTTTTIGDILPASTTTYFSSAYGRPVQLSTYLPYDTGAEGQRYTGWHPECYARDPGWMSLETGGEGNCMAGTCDGMFVGGGFGGCGVGGFGGACGGGGGGGCGGGCGGGGGGGCGGG